MNKNQTPSRRLKSIAGVTLLALGLIFLLSNLDALAASMNGAAGRPPVESSPTTLDVAIAGMHAAEIYVFDHPHFLSTALSVLVSFWPLSLVVGGAYLLRHIFIFWLSTHIFRAGSL